MENPLIKNNVEILKKIRLLNIEISKLLYSNLEQNDTESDYLLNKTELENKKKVIDEDKKNIEASIDDEQNNINNTSKEIDDILSSNKKNNITSEETQEKLDILDLKIKLSKKRIDEYKKKVSDLENTKNDIDKELEFLNNTYNKELLKLSDKTRLENEKYIEINKTINYTLDLLNNNVRSKYENIMFFIKKMWNGFPVGVVKNGFCENCNIKVCLQKEVDILNMNNFVMCDMCGCFLVDVVKEENDSEV